MRLLRAALENEEVSEITNISDSEINQTIDAIEKNELMSHVADNEIGESEDIQKSINVFTEQVEKSVDSGEGLSDKTAEAIGVAIEHFCNRLNYKKEVMPAMECFSEESTRLENSKVLLGNLKELEFKINNGLSVAQEGFVDDFQTSVKMIFETKVKILQKLEVVVNKYKSGTKKEDKIADSGYSKYLDGSDGDSVIKQLETGKNFLLDKTSADIINKLTTIIKKITAEIRGNWFYSNERDIYRIQDLHQMVLDMKSKNNNIGVNKELAPLTANQVEKLYVLVKETLTSDLLTIEVNKFNNKTNWHRLWSLWQSFFRVKSILSRAALGALRVPTNIIMGLSVTQALHDETSGDNAVGKVLDAMSPEDTRKAMAVVRDARNIVRDLYGMGSSKLKVCSAVVSYIDASVE